MERHSTAAVTGAHVDNQPIFSLAVVRSLANKKKRVSGRTQTDDDIDDIDGGDDSNKP